tara:strand:- start:445 stop:579 length:135 start_codon:yes stop_codon:yes gene_type:complete
MDIAVNSVFNPKKFLTEFYQKMSSHLNGSEAFLKNKKHEKDREF